MSEPIDMEAARASREAKRGASKPEPTAEQKWEEQALKATDLAQQAAQQLATTNDLAVALDIILSWILRDATTPEAAAKVLTTVRDYAALGRLQLQCGGTQKLTAGQLETMHRIASERLTNMAPPAAEDGGANAQGA